MLTWEGLMSDSHLLMHEFKNPVYSIYSDFQKMPFLGLVLTLQDGPEQHLQKCSLGNSNAPRGKGSVVK